MDSLRGYPLWDCPLLQGKALRALPLASRVLLENGANAAVLGEYHGSFLHYENILYCISGEGFRCGVMMNGRLVRTKTGDASAYGHITMDSRR